MPSTRLVHFSGLNLRLLAGGVVLAAAAWSVYAWRFSRQSGTSIGPSDVSAGNTAPHDAAVNQTAREALLRAERSDAPSESNDAAAAPRVMANVPNSMKNAPISLPPPVEKTEALQPPPRRQPPSDTADHSAIEASPPENSAAAASLIQSGKAALQQGENIQARDEFSRALALEPEIEDAGWIRQELQRLSNVLLFSRATNLGDPLVDVHVMKSGELLLEVANRFQITPELIATLNRLPNPDYVAVGARLKVIRGPFRAEIDKSDHRLDLWIGDTYIRSVDVGLGADNGTPTGKWKVISKVKNPDWVDPVNGIRYSADDPRNPIGECWIGLHCIDGACLGQDGFGIHGTIEPESIGRDRSMGCVRLLADDISSLYDLLLPERSTVTILP